MGDVEMTIIFPAPAIVFGAFLGVLVFYTLYRLAKFFISLWTGS